MANAASQGTVGTRVAELLAEATPRVARALGIAWLATVATLAHAAPERVEDAQCLPASLCSATIDLATVWSPGFGAMQLDQAKLMSATAPLEPAGQRSAFHAEPRGATRPSADKTQLALTLLGAATEQFLHVDTDSITSEYAQFYSPDRLTRFAVVLSSASLLANTSADENVHEWYQGGVRSSGSDSVSRVSKLFGEGSVMIPLSMIAASAGHFFDSDDSEEPSSIEEWGERTRRAYALGAPALLMLQGMTGGTRPGNSPTGARWNPYAADNGVSGHAFIGAVPFLSLARMHEDEPALKYAFYALSGLAAWSRVNDDDHYLSQAVLGWYLAWEATEESRTVRRKPDSWTIRPTVSSDGYGIYIGVRF